MKQVDIARNLRIASPCHEAWERMIGDERVRHCDSCHLNVYNFSEMTTGEIAALILKTEGRVCGRIYLRSDGTMLTRDCPVGLRAVRMRVAKFATAVFATVLSFLSIVSAQTKQGQAKSTFSIEQIGPQQDKGATLAGILLSGQDAVTAGGQLTLKKKSGGLEQFAKTDSEGTFSLAGLTDGEYSLTISVAGFKTFVVESIEIKTGNVYRAKIMLNDLIYMTGAVAIAEMPPQPEFNNGTMITDPTLLKTRPTQSVEPRRVGPELGFLIDGLEVKESKSPGKKVKNKNDE